MGRKLLVADDSVTIQKVIKLALSSEGYDILAVSEGKEAIRAIQEERPDVVLIDVTLPGADAYAVKRAINANPALQGTGFILMLSAFERVDEKLIEEVQFQGRLIKPFDPSHLRKAVADILAAAASGGSKPAATVAIPPAAPQEEDEDEDDTPLPPPPASAAFSESDLPPVRDEHPTIAEEPTATPITEEEFDLKIAPPPPAPTLAAAPPPATERTDPNFSLPPESIPPQQIVETPIEEEAAPEPEAEAEVEAEGEVAAEEAEATRSLENDIRDLTESTIKMSGLDEFQWSLDDSKKMKQAQPEQTQSTPPPPAAASRSVVQNTTPPRMDTGSIEEPAYSPPSPTKPTPAPSLDKRTAALRSLMTAPAKPIDDGGSTFPLGNLSAQPERAATPPPAAKPAAPAPKPPQPAVAPPAPVAPTIEISVPAQAAASAAPSPISRAEIEAIIRKDLEAVIEKIAREAVPRIAEAMIRQEIEKILAEP